MAKKLYVSYEKARMIIDKILPVHIGSPFGGCYGEEMVNKRDVLYILDKLVEIKDEEAGTENEEKVTYR